MKCRLIVVPGWAHDERDMSGFASGLQSRFDVCVISVSGLWKIGRGSFARGLKDVVEKDGSDFCLAGWSLGAMIVLEAVTRLGVCPCSIMLFGATAKFCRAGEYRCGQPERVVRAMESALGEDHRKVLRDFYQNACGPADFDEKAAGERIDRVTKDGLDGLSAGLVYLRETDLRADLPGLDIPVLLAHGGRDAIVPKEAGMYLAEKIKSSSFFLHENAGHAMIVSNGAEAAVDLIKFSGGDACIL